MAASDATAIPIKNQAYRVYFPIYDNDGDLVASAAGLDSEISKDGGAFADATNEATQIATSSGMYFLDLTATEMNADCVVIIVKTTTTDAKTTPIVLYPAEDGDIVVNVKQVNGTVQTANDNGADINTLLTRLVGTIAAGTHNAQSGDAFARLGAPAGASVSADIADVKTDTSYLIGYLGEYGIGIYIDAAAANTNTVAGTDGTRDNPVSTLTAARTIADAIGAKTYYIINGSTLTLAAQHEHWTFVGLSERAFNVIDLGSQDVDGSRFINVTIQGTQGGTQRIYAADCALQDPGAGTTTLNIFAVRCGIVDDISLDGSSDNVMIGCFSLVAGNSAPIVRATGASGTFVMRDQLGGVDLRDLAASHTVTLEGIGQVIFDASCNVNAAVTLRGVGNKTDNTAGMANLTETAYISNTSIDALLDVIKGAGFAEATDSLEAIRDRGDAAWTTGAGGTPPQLLQSTTINTLTSQTVFTLTAGSADDDAYNGAIAVITDAVTGTQKAFVDVSDYVGGTLTLTLASAPVFTISGGDSIDLIAASAAAGGGLTQQDVRDAMKLAPTGGAPSAGSVDEHLDDILADTNELQTDDVPGLIAALPTAAAIGDAVWDEPIAGHVTAGTFGAYQTTWDDILIDTGVTLDNKLDQIVSDVTDILLDTGSTGVVISTATAQAIADEFLKRDMSAVTGEASRSPLNALRFLRNRWTVVGTTLTVYEEDDATSAWTGVVSTDAAADPVTGNDPA